MGFCDLNLANILQLNKITRRQHIVPKFPKKMEKLTGITVRARFFKNIKPIHRGLAFLMNITESACCSKKFLFLILLRLIKKYEWFLKTLMEK